MSGLNCPQEAKFCSGGWQGENVYKSEKIVIVSDDAEFLTRKVVEERENICMG